MAPLQNRVTPLGEIVADPARGHVYGNRGCLHDAEGRIVRRQATRRWIACRLEFKGWYRSPVPQPGKFTGLFFLDDATALAAGHRPCALCRRADYNVLVERLGLGGADAIDLVLDRERNGPRDRARIADLPDGAFVLVGGAPHLVLEGTVRPWSHGGYGAARRHGGDVEVITPASLVRLLRGGWDPVVPFIAL